MSRNKKHSSQPPTTPYSTIQSSSAHHPAGLPTLIPTANSPKSIRNQLARLAQLEGRSRMLQKYSKRNLKLAFEEKIKAYRLQSYMDRKDHQQRIEQQLWAREAAMLDSKSRKTRETKMNLSVGKEIALSRKEFYTQRIRNTMLQQHQQNVQDIKQASKKQLEARRRSRDQILIEKEQERERKQLLEQLFSLRKKEMRVFAVKQELQTLAAKQQKLWELKEELQSMIRSRSKSSILQRTNYDPKSVNSIINL